MKRKNFLPLLLVTLLYASCSTTTDKIEGISHPFDSSVLIHKIDSVGTAYLKGTGVPTMYASDTGSSQDDNTSLKKDDDNSVFLADAIGFGLGMATGGGEGIIAGALIGTTIAPGIGTAGGALAGTVDILVGGIALGTLSSVAVAHDNHNDSTENGDEIYWEKPDWITYNEDILFDENVIGANIGWYHNNIIQGIWQNYSPDEITNAIGNHDILDYITSYMEERELFLFEDRGAFTNALLELWVNHDNYRDFIAPYCNQIIDEYFATIKELDKEEWYPYTQSIMVEIDGGGLPEEDAILLNGTISIFYYSSTLWNMDAINNLPRL